MNFEELKDRVRSKPNDWVLPVKNIGMEQGEENFEMSIKGNKYFLSDRAKMQLLASLDIPLKYFERCPASLQRAQLDYWRTHSQKAIYIRAAGKKIRAIASDKYRRFDNLEFLSIVEQVLSEYEYEIVYENVTSDCISIGVILNSRGLWRTGLMFTNSEVLATGIVVEEFLFLKSLGYGFVGDKVYRARHSKDMKERLLEELTNVLLSRDDLDTMFEKYDVFNGHKKIDLSKEFLKENISNLEEMVEFSLDGALPTIHSVVKILLPIISKYEKMGQMRYMRKIGNIIRRVSK